MSILGTSIARRVNKGEFLQAAPSKAAYSPKGEYFVYLSLAIDKHRLRVYDTATGKSIAEHVVESGRITAMSWQEIDEDLAGDGDATRKKKRKKSRPSSSSQGSIQVVALGLSNGTLSFFSPARNQVVHTATLPTSSTAIVSIASPPSPESSKASVVWTSSADGSIRAWDLRTNKVAGTWQDPDRTPYTSIALRPSDESDDALQILAGHHNIRLLSVEPSTSSSAADTKPPKVLSTFTGHASSISSLLWDASTSSASRRFVSSAEDDRSVQVWQMPPTLDGTSGRLVATVPLDSDVRAIALSSQTTSSSPQTLLALSQSGAVSLYSLPATLAATTKKGEPKIPTLTPQSALSLATTESDADSSPIIAAQFVPALPGHINVARVVSMRPIFETLQYLDDSGKFIPRVTVERRQTEDLGLGATNDVLLDKPRYNEKTANIESGAQLPRSEAADDEPEGVNGELDADMAELTLGQRLTALNARLPNGVEEAEASSSKQGKVAAVTLTRTLTQALHSGDAQLMEACLTTADERTVKGTVQGLRQEHVVPLVDMLVERLAKGGSGGVGGASTEHATTIVVWLRVVLFVHASYLMTRPDLVSRLAALHGTLNARSVLQDRLQMLNGRLDLVFSQVRMRNREYASAGKGSERVKTLQYIEGESSEEDLYPEADMDVDVEDDDDEGSVQDIELGSESGEEDDDDEDNDDSDGGSSNFLIDDEAEESEGEGEGSVDLEEESD